MRRLKYWIVAGKLYRRRYIRVYNIHCCIPIWYTVYIYSEYQSDDMNVWQKIKFVWKQICQNNDLKILVSILSWNNFWFLSSFFQKTKIALFTISGTFLQPDLSWSQYDSSPAYGIYDASEDLEIKKWTNVIIQVIQEKVDIILIE